MLQTTLKSLFARKFRLVMSVLSIVLGIAFVSGSLMFTNLLARSFDEIVASTVGDVNVVQEHTGFEEFTTEVMEPSTFLTGDDVKRAGEVDGVAEISGVVSSAQVFLLDVDGRLVAMQGAPGIGSNWHETPAAKGLEGARIVDGKAPTKDDEVVIDPGTVTRSGHQIGDRVKVSTPLNGVQEYTLSGTATYGSGSTAGASYLFFTLPESQRIFADGHDHYQGMWISTDSGADPDQVAAAVEEDLPDGWQTQTGDELAAEVEEMLDVGMGFVNALLLVFAAIALLVATLLILNTFSILIAGRAREMAVLRAIGATRRQVRRSVLLEAIIMGVIGSTLGIAVGYGLVWVLTGLMSRVGMNLGDAVPQLTWPAVVVSYAVGLVITIIAALVPAIRASRTRPVEALAEASTPKEVKDGSGLSVAGVVVIEIAIALIVIGIWLDVPRPLAWIGGGAGLMLIGFVLAAPFVGAPVIALFGRLFRVPFGEVGRMAERNSKRQPRRTAATAATLMIGLALVTTVAVLASSVTASMRESLSKDQRGDFVIAHVFSAPFDAKAADKVAAVEGVDWVATFTPNQAIPEGSETPVKVLGTSPRGLLEASAVELAAGSMTEHADSAVISGDFAQKHDLQLGMKFDLKGNVGTQRLLVTGLVTDDPPVDVILNQPTLAKIADVSQINQIVVFTDDGADPKQLRQQLLDATTDHPTVSVADVNEYVEQRVGQIQGFVNWLYGLLGLALVISVLGIVNTLSLSVIERTREIGLLRAVGVTRGQIRRMISLESVLISVMGSVLGVGLGLLFGWMLQVGLRDSGIHLLDIPWVQVVLFVVVAAVFGWLAAIAPARRAARLPVLESIATE